MTATPICSPYPRLKRDYVELGQPKGDVRFTPGTKFYLETDCSTDQPRISVVMQTPSNPRILRVKMEDPLPFSHKIEDIAVGGLLLKEDVQAGVELGISRALAESAEFRVRQMGTSIILVLMLKDWSTKGAIEKNESERFVTRWDKLF